MRRSIWENHLPGYDRSRSYAWNYAHAPGAPPRTKSDTPLTGDWKFCGLAARSPIGVPAGPLLNGRWCLYYAALGFDVLTYKTVRSRARACYDLPNLEPVDCGQIDHAFDEVPTSREMRGSWAVSFGMPSAAPAVWRADVAYTRRQLAAEKLLVVSVVGTDREGWSLDDVAADYARCAAWACEAGADAIEANLSCPNVATCDGQLYQHPRSARLVAQRIKAAIGSRPLILKIGYFARREQAIGLVEEVAPYASALAMTNSIATKVRTSCGDLLFAGERRGICGEATFSASVTQTSTFAELIDQRRLDLDLIGVGGAACYDDCQRYLDAGAHAVQLATAAMVDPLVALRIKRDWAS